MIADERIAEVAAALQPLCPVKTRRMFGAAAIYCRGHMFALLHDGALYVRSDEASEGRFEEAGCPAFIPTYKSGRHARMPYRRLPDEAQRPGSAMLLWARLGLEASERVAGRASPQRRRTG